MKIGEVSEKFDLIHAAVDRGVTFFDTAEWNPNPWSLPRSSVPPSCITWTRLWPRWKFNSVRMKSSTWKNHMYRRLSLVLDKVNGILKRSTLYDCMDERRAQ